MENIKIFARPEAYKLLTNPSEGERLKAVIEEAFAVAHRKGGEERRFVLPKNTDFGIITRWATHSSKESAVLIFSFQDEEKYNLLDPVELEFAIKEAIPIPFLD